MKRTAMILALAFLVILTAFGQNKKLSLSGVGNSSSAQLKSSPTDTVLNAPALSASLIRLENDSNQLVFYTVIPLKTGELAGLLGNSKLAIERLRALTDKLEYLAASTVAPAIAISDSEQLIIGFALEAGTSAYPMWYASIPGKTERTENIYQLSRVKPLLDEQQQPAFIRPMDFDLPATAIRIDGRFVDWLKFQDTLSWPLQSQPLKITRQSDGIENISLENALSFQRGGTDVEHVRMIRTANDLMVMVSSHSVMSKGLSYLFRLYANNQEKTNRFTLEIPIDGQGGPVLLWTSGKKEPQILGNFAIADYYVEARFSLKTLPAGLSKLFASDWIIELSSAWSDSSMSEEYFWGRFPASTIVKRD